MIVTITEYDQLPIDRHGRILPIGGRRLAGQGLTANGVGTAFATETRFVRVCGDTAIHFRITGNTAATNQFEYVPADTPEFFEVNGGMVPSIISA